MSAVTPVAAPVPAPIAPAPAAPVPGPIAPADDPARYLTTPFVEIIGNLNIADNALNQIINGFGTSIGRHAAAVIDSGEVYRLRKGRHPNIDARLEFEYNEIEIKRQAKVHMINALLDEYVMLYIRRGNLNARAIYEREHKREKDAELARKHYRAMQRMCTANEIYHAQNHPARITGIEEVHE